MNHNKERPLITFALFAYNQEKYIRDAVEGAFSQTYSPLEIILSDDCSTDKTFEIMTEMVKNYKGGNSVIVRKNANNCGLISHINEVMKIVTGELIVAAAGDDISFPYRTQKIVEEYMNSNRNAYSIYSNAIWIDENNFKMNVQRKKKPNKHSLQLIGLTKENQIGIVTGATHAFQKKVFDYFGPLNKNIGAEDTIIPFRSALLGEILYIDECLIYYRRDEERLRKGEKKYSLQNYRQKWMIKKQQYLYLYGEQLCDVEKVNNNEKDLQEIKKNLEKKIYNQELIIHFPLISRFLINKSLLKKILIFIKVFLIKTIVPLYEFVLIFSYHKYQNIIRYFRRRVLF